MTQMCTYFKTKTDAAQNLINNFFLTLIVRGPFNRKDLSEKKCRSTELISEKMEAFYVELNERAEAATNNFSSI